MEEYYTYPGTKSPVADGAPVGGCRYAQLRRRLPETEQPFEGRALVGNGARQMKYSEMALVLPALPTYFLTMFCTEQVLSS